MSVKDKLKELIDTALDGLSGLLQPAPQPVPVRIKPRPRRR